jgi:3-oxoacyl-[acyl-carrier protein] reductase
VPSEPSHVSTNGAREEPEPDPVRAGTAEAGRLAAGSQESHLDRVQGVALVTGGGRGIGERIARELAEAGMRVAVTGRTREQVEAVAADVGGLALVGDVTVEDEVTEWVARTEEELGPIELLVANAGVGGPREPTWEADVARWWQTLEINLLGVHLCCRAVVPGMLERGRGRIVITGSGAAYLPGSRQTAYPASKAAACRYGETLANELRDRIPVFFFSPGLVRTEMTEGSFADDAPWTPPELAPRLVRVLASGRADALAGRYLHAEHDDVEELIRRADEIVEQDLNAIRLRR